MSLASNAWPALPYGEWKDSCHTLHRWLQIAGKVRTTLSPWSNHSWGTTLFVTARGIGTPLIPARDHGFAIEFDFVEHRLKILRTDGAARSFALTNESVASFYRRFTLAMGELGIDLCFSLKPNEVPDPILFPMDETHCTYDPDQARRFWQVLVRVERVMQVFRSRFLGKCSPVHLFWGSLDLAVTRFSGRRAPEHPGGVPGLPDEVTREAYSHEVSSCGFWPGNDLLPYPAFYSYAYPQPAGFEQAEVLPKEAFYHPRLREFILPYETARVSRDPEAMLLEFFQNTYEAAARLGGWDRDLLENSPYLKALQEKEHPLLRPEAPDLKAG